MTRGECLEPGLGSPEMMADLEDQTADPTREELAEGPPPPPGWELGVAMGDIDPETNKKCVYTRPFRCCLVSRITCHQNNQIAYGCWV